MSTIVEAAPTARLSVVAPARAPPVVAEPRHPECGDPRRDARLLLRLEGRVLVARPTRLDSSADAPQRLPDVARRPTQRGQPECGHRSVQQLRVVLGRPRLVADPVLRLDDVDRHGRRGRSRRPSLRRGEGGDLGDRSFRDVRAERTLAGEHPDARPDDRGRLALPPGRNPPGHRRWTVGSFRARDHADPRRHADHPGVRVPDADRDSLLGRSGRSGDHDDDLRRPAGDPHHRPRHPRRFGEHGRGRAGDGVHEATGPAEGAIASRATDAAPRRQSDDSLRALHGGDRRSDRRQGPRRRRHERAELVSGPGDPRRAS